MALALAGLGLMIVMGADDAVQDQAEASLMALSNEGAKVADARIANEFTYLEGLANLPEVQSATRDIDALMTILLRRVEETNFLRIGLADLNGNLYLSDSYGLNNEIVNISERGYYHESLAGERGLMPPSSSVNPDDGDRLIMVNSVPVVENNQVTGVIVAVGDADMLNTIVDDVQFGEQGYAYMVSDEGTVVAHPNRELVFDFFNPIMLANDNPSYESVGNQFVDIISNPSGIGEYTFRGNDLYVGYADIGTTGWNLVVTANVDDVLAEVQEMRLTAIILTLFIVFIAIIITYFIGSRIAKPIQSVTKTAVALSELDLRHNVDQKHLKRNDEVGKLARSLQGIGDSLRAIVHQINDSAGDVSASSEQLTATSQQSSSMSIEVATTIQDIADGAANQAENTEQTSEKAYRLGEIVEQEQEVLKRLNEANEEVQGAVESGMAEIKRLAAISNQTSKATKDVQEGIGMTNESANQISEASNLIASIADQTNLLALNAAIEAARAGEAGKGFSVVAEEIRKLAEQSTASTSSIDAIVRDLQTNSKQSVDVMADVSVILEEQLESVNLTQQKYKDIEKAMDVSTDAVARLNETGHEINSIKGDITSSLESLSAIAEENSAATEEASAAVEEQSSSMEEITGSSESLAELAMGLKKLVEKFKL